MTDAGTESRNGAGGAAGVFDVGVVGAGFAGLYLLHRLRAMGLSAQGFETGHDVGGTWYWNRYPGARCDIESLDYSYSFDPELDAEWTWSERYATQPEILTYLGHVADRFDLRRDIRFSTRIDRAEWSDDDQRWALHTSDGDIVGCRHYVMATGCLSVPKEIDIAGADSFGGDTHLTGRWPHEGVDFTGKRVAVIGTGSSAIQSIPVIAAQAAELTVYQRTPNFSIPAHNGPHDPDRLAALEADRAAFREANRQSQAGVDLALPELSVFQVSDEEREAAFQGGWDHGGILSVLSTFNDLLFNPAANELAAEFVRGKIREIVDDPVTAEALCPDSYPIGTKRLCCDDGYYAVFNQPHVSLVDLRSDPIVEITPSGITTETGSRDVDVIVFATGFDAMTGAIVSVDIAGRDGFTLADAWADGPRTYLGLGVVGFPNLHTVTGPGSPSVLSNMVVSIEQHVDWVCDTIAHMEAEGLTTIEPTPLAQESWGTHVNDFADITLYPQANSWYMGANVPGKPRMFLPYIGGVGGYRRICEEVVERGYLGWRFDGPAGTVCNDGEIRRIAPDVGLMLEAMAEMGLPPIETLPVDDARAFMEASAGARAPGPEVGEVVDGVYEGADGPLPYRLYRPSTPGPHPVVAYFHGGGWVLGHATSDDPLCRDLCVRADVAIVSFDYRHAPEHRFPAAPEDAYAAVRWLAANADQLGVDGARMAVAGWSAGGNLAAVVAQMVRDRGGPELVGQLMLTPVTDGSVRRPSMSDNGEGYALTEALMDWFWDHYLDAGERADPLASPLCAASLEGLPPAMVVTAEFDPLRDEGDAYADALVAAGVEVYHLPARGQIHTSITAVDMLPSPAYVREEMADQLRSWLS